jgi:hypothetical protein
VRSSGNEDKEGEEVEDSIHLELDNKFEECSEVEVDTDEQGVVGKAPFVDDEQEKKDNPVEMKSLEDNTMGRNIHELHEIDGIGCSQSRSSHSFVCGS